MTKEGPDMKKWREGRKPERNASHPSFSRNLKAACTQARQTCQKPSETPTSAEPKLAREALQGVKRYTSEAWKICRCSDRGEWKRRWGAQLSWLSVTILNLKTNITSVCETEANQKKQLMLPHQINHESVTQPSIIRTLNGNQHVTLLP